MGNTGRYVYICVYVYEAHLADAVHSRDGLRLLRRVVRGLEHVERAGDGEGEAGGGGPGGHEEDVAVGVVTEATQALLGVVDRWWIGVRLRLNKVLDRGQAG